MLHNAYGDPGQLVVGFRGVKKGKFLLLTSLGKVPVSAHCHDRFLHADCSGSSTSVIYRFHKVTMLFGLRYTPKCY
jgi:hypothetical protein